jgi:hypothetical protein
MHCLLFLEDLLPYTKLQTGTMDFGVSLQTIVVLYAASSESLVFLTKCKIHINSQFIYHFYFIFSSLTVQFHCKKKHRRSK